MNYKNLQISFFLAIFLGALILTFFIFLPYLSPLLLGVIFAIIFNPFHKKILKAVNNRETLAALISTAIVLIIVLAPLTFFGIKIFGEAKNLYVSIITNNNTNGFSGQIINFIQNNLKTFLPNDSVSSIEEISATLRDYFQQVLNWFLQNLGPIISSVVKILFNLILSLFALYYLLRDGHKFKRSIVALSPLADHYDQELMEKLHKVVSSVVRGTLVMAVIQGIIAAVGFTIFGVPHAAIWGSLTVIAALIPVVGTAIITVPASAYLLITGNLFNGLALLIWGTVLVGSIDNFLRPKLIEKGVNIHSFLILLSVLGGIGLFGPIGFLLGPLVLSMFLALADIYQREFKEYIHEKS